MIMELKLAEKFPQRIVCLNIGTTNIDDGFASENITRETLIQLIKVNFKDEYEINWNTDPNIRVTDDKIEVILVVKKKASSANSPKGDISDLFPKHTY